MTTEIERMPSLARLFALFGAVAAFFVILTLGAFRQSGREVSLFTPIMVTAVIGAGAGMILRGWRELHDPLAKREVIIGRVGTITVLAGTASGAMIAFVTWGIEGVPKFAWGGALAGVLFLPSCLVVFDAAKRAGRGRHGSLVAATDRRTVLSTVLGGVAFAGAIQVPALLSGEGFNDFQPLARLAVSFAACVGPTLAIIVLQRRDRRDRAALDAFVADAPWLDRVEDEAAPDTNAVDLGVGADNWARSIDASYRTSGRTEVLVKGSVSDATAAFDECTRRRHRSLLVSVAGLTAVLLSFVLRLSVFL